MFSFWVLIRHTPKEKEWEIMVLDFKGIR